MLRGWLPVRLQSPPRRSIRTRGSRQKLTPTALRRRAHLAATFTKSLVREASVAGIIHKLREAEVLAALGRAVAETARQGPANRARCATGQEPSRNGSAARGPARQCPLLQ